MIDHGAWKTLDDALDRWTAVERRARLWLRDDDAIEPTKALDRLLGLTAAHSIPLTLAVIPAPTGTELAERLAAGAGLSVAVHGWSHKNHASIDEKKQELGSHRPAEIVLGELRQGHDRLRELYPHQFVPMLVPPWNRVAPALVPALGGCGFSCLSVYGPSKTTSPIPLVNTHLDIMDWHGTGGGRGHGELVSGLIGELQRRFDGDPEPVGVLTHHLVHDETAWEFVEHLLRVTAGHPAVEWVSVADMLPGRRG